MTFSNILALIIKNMQIRSVVVSTKDWLFKQNNKTKKQY